MSRTLNVLLAGIALQAMSSPARGDTGARIEHGKIILDAQCAGCHATGAAGNSPLAIAPPFRDLNRKYNVEFLAEALAEGIVTGHPGMPPFMFPPDEIDAIITYLKSLPR